jgi:hypothetical protein
MLASCISTRYCNCQTKASKKREWTYRESNALGRAVEALHVHVGTEETSLSVLVLVGLHTLKALKGIVEDNSGGIQLELSILLDLGDAPSLAGLPLNGQHVVGEGLAKDQLRVLLESLLVLGRVDLELGGVEGGKGGGAVETRGRKDLGGVL